MPKQKPKARVQIPPHKHCPICGKSIPIDADYCSNKCRAEALKRQQAERRNMMIMFGIMFGLTAVLFLIMMIFGGR